MKTLEIQGNKIRAKKVGEKVYVPCKDIGDILGLANARDTANYYVEGKDKKLIQLRHLEKNQKYNHLCVTINGIKKMTTHTRKGLLKDKELILDEIVPQLEEIERGLKPNIKQDHAAIAKQNIKEERLIDKFKNLLRKVGSLVDY